MLIIISNLIILVWELEKVSNRLYKDYNIVTNILLFIFLTIHLNNISWLKWLQVPLYSPSMLFTIINNRILSRGKNSSVVSRIFNYVELIKKS